VTYREDGLWRAGVLVGEVVVDAAGAATGRPRAPGPLSTRQILEADRDLLRKLQAAAGDIAADEAQGGRRAAEVELGPPVPDPEKIVCLGLNYRDHADEMALEPPSAPTLFPKFRNALLGSGHSVVIPPASAQVDFEGELAVVIGRRCKDVPEAEALGCVAGYMPFNDVSARDLQMATSQWTAGKVPDTFAPCGPALVLSDEVPDPQSLRISTRVNGVTLQSASTADMIFPVAQIVSFLSRLMTLEAGDVIATGTPPGVGYSRRPPVFLAPGDVVEVEIDSLGTLRNPVAAATDGSSGARA
jgi:2-keto-4-pentenoate hydratase/2-oxohepta-3-ene-1,7-dioic acid hydratase in catechol pathway